MCVPDDFFCIKVVICGKNNTLNKTINNSRISLEINILLISIVLFSLKLKIAEDTVKESVL